MPCLIVPGLHSSGPDHWQSRWERRRGDCRRAELGGWDDPIRASWIGRLADAVDGIGDPAVLVAHSLGCLAVAGWAEQEPRAADKIAGALLVAPPDVEGSADELRRFAPLPRKPLPFPAIVVGSRNDPYASFARLRGMAASWGARFHDAGEMGHINSESGLGDWSEGQALLAELAPERSPVRSKAPPVYRRPRA